MDPIQLLNSLIEQQRKNLLRCAKKKVPSATEDDLLQPNDFLEWELDPIFRYEEGVLHGFLAAKAALLAEFSVSKISS